MQLLNVSGAADQSISNNLQTRKEEFSVKSLQYVTIVNNYNIERTEPAIGKLTCESSLWEWSMWTAVRRLLTEQ